MQWFCYVVITGIFFATFFIDVWLFTLYLDLSIIRNVSKLQDDWFQDENFVRKSVGLFKEYTSSDEDDGDEEVLSLIYSVHTSAYLTKAIF